jgi:hypothetical protein
VAAVQQLHDRRGLVPIMEFVHAGRVLLSVPLCNNSMIGAGRVAIMQVLLAR